MKKILVVSLTNLGDAILSYPAIHALWAAYPNAQFHLLVSSRNRELFEGNSQVSRIWVRQKRAPFYEQAALVAQLMGERFDLVVDFPNSMIPGFLWGAKRAPFFRKPPPPDEHRAQTHLNLVAALVGVPPLFKGVRMPYGPPEEAAVKVWLEPNRRPVVMVPGARSHTKRWSASGFARVGDRLAREQNAQILLAGEPAERPIAGEVRACMKQPAVDLVGKTTLRQLAALLARTKLVITNDSAGLHAAEVMSVPVVAIFGPTDEKKYGPQNPRSLVVRRHLVCAPCEKALCAYDQECMRWVTAEEVYAAAVKILEAADT